ncbi:MAG: AAA family ATPase [Acidimicrobiales bacterium]
MASAPNAITSLVRPAGKVDDLGIPQGLAEDLFMRRVLSERITTVGEVAALLHIGHAVADELAASLREKALVEYLGVTGRDYRIQLTELGARTTNQRMATGRHVGPMPVSLIAYQAVVRAQQSRVTLDRTTIAAAFDDLVVDEALLDQIGPAFNGGGAIFLYGPAGTGKTSLAERLNRVLREPVYVPRYVETDGQLISVYDPSLHRAVADQPPDVDQRWVRCERPLVIVGGELDLSMIDLQYDRISGTSVAPIQMLANNGILVIDDFGRQAFRPDEILNRWIVPLSRGVDYLKANTGTKFTVPFEVKLVISTNLDPRSLGDDAFLRRLRNKVFVGPVTEEAFTTITRAAATASGLVLRPDAIERLIEASYDELGELRPYLAVDICELAVAVVNYDGIDPVLDARMVERVSELYFVQSEAEELESRHLDVWNAPHDGHPNGLWNDYEIGGVEHDFLAGLEALAATQIVENDELGGTVPPALQGHGAGGIGA